MDHVWLKTNQCLFKSGVLMFALIKLNQRSYFVRVKLLKIPMEAWSVKGIIALASSLGNPIIMVEVTTRMCLTWEGRLGFAKVLVEISADKILNEKIEIVYKRKNISDGTKKVEDLECTWKPYVCTHCIVFGHEDKRCSVRKRIEKENVKEKTNDNVLLKYNIGNKPFQKKQYRKTRNEGAENSNMVINKRRYLLM